MDLDTHKMCVSRDVIFHEHIFPFAHPPQDKLLFQSQSLQQYAETEPMPDFRPAPADSPTAAQPTADSPPRRSSRHHSMPHYLQDYVCCSHTTGHTSCFSTLTNLCLPVSLAAEVQVPTADHMVTEPQTYREACTHPGWQLAMDKEIQALIDNNTWEIVSLPSGKRPVSYTHLTLPTNREV